MVHHFGIDLGGTKIEAKEFNVDWHEVRCRRIPTPQTGYEGLLAGLCELIEWLRVGHEKPITVGVGLPGYIDPATGESFTTNIEAKGRRLRRDLAAIPGIHPIFENDCNCFALSEAVLGAGRGHRVVVGLIIGTGLGGGVVIDGKLQQGAHGTVGEFGHIGIPASLIAKHGLPILQCGCGRMGCYEMLASGRGMTRLCQALTGTEASALAIALAAAEGNKTMQRVLSVWAEIIGELIATMQCITDPDCIVLGGGLSRIEGVEQLVTNAAQLKFLPATRGPIILHNQGGDSSGTRGAALLTLQSR